MRHNKQAQRSPAKAWNPPPIPPEADMPLQPPQPVVSATDCTGLEARPILNESAAEHIASLCAIHTQKPQGNIGKCNPTNDPEEIAFHRTSTS